MSLPASDSLLACRDRAILKFYVYSGARLATGCRLTVGDFHQDERAATIRINEKGQHRRTIGLHFAAAQAIQEYIDRANLTSGPSSVRSTTLKAMSLRSPSVPSRPQACTS